MEHVLLVMQGPRPREDTQGKGQWDLLGERPMYLRLLGSTGDEGRVMGAFTTTLLCLGCGFPQCTCTRWQSGEMWS